MPEYNLKDAIPTTKKELRQLALDANVVIEQYDQIRDHINNIWEIYFTCNDKLYVIVRKLHD